MMISVNGIPYSSKLFSLLWRLSEYDNDDDDDDDDDEYAGGTPPKPCIVEHCINSTPNTSLNWNAKSGNGCVSSSVVTVVIIVVCVRLSSTTVLVAVFDFVTVDCSVLEGPIPTSTNSASLFGY